MDGGDYLFGLGSILILTAFGAAYLFAIIGVGVIRNSVQISLVERIKDYGSLRCLGATKKQIRAIIFREAFLLESVGIAGGIVVGYIASVFLSSSLELPTGFHFLPIVFLAITFYGDMYFAIGDASKAVLKVSPVDAVKGTYRIKTGRTKRTRSGIWGILFGIEGDYAYKNLKRNRGRFLKITLAMTFGMITVVVVGGLAMTIFKITSQISKQFGYYQQYQEAEVRLIDTIEEMQTDLYSPEALDIISNARGVASTKYVYKYRMLTAEDRWINKNINKAYCYETYESSIYTAFGDLRLDDADEEEELKASRKAYWKTGKGLVDYEAMEKLEDVSKPDNTRNVSDIRTIYSSSLTIYGYDEEDYARYSDYLIDGTLELSENGILLVNQAKLTPKMDYLSDYLFSSRQDYTFLDIKVGDEIKLVDPAELRELIKDEIKNAKAYDEYVKGLSDAWEKEHEGEKDEEGKELSNPYENYNEIMTNGRKYAWIINAAREKLIDEGKYKTYIVEGLIRDDPNRAEVMPSIIVPLDKYYEMTGLTENDYTGFQFHIGNMFSSDLSKEKVRNAINENVYDSMETGEDISNVYTSGFVDMIETNVTTVRILIVICAVVFVIVLTNLFNTMNVTIASLQLRRNEFAQLRAIGMTERSLLKSVMLEGVIVWAVSSIIGVVIGLLVEYYYYSLELIYLINEKMQICWPAIIIAVVFSFLALVCTNRTFFKQMKLDVAEELTHSGE